MPAKTALSGLRGVFPAFSRTRGTPRASCRSPNRNWDAGLARKRGIARAARLLRSNTSFRQIAASLALRSISQKRAECILEARNETLEYLRRQALGTWVCFYEDDYKFEPFWREPKKYLDLLGRFDGVVAPDFSLYADFTPSQLV